MAEEILRWPEIEDAPGKGKWESILVGNGASRAVWNLFAYESLYDAATAGKVQPALSSRDIALFDGLKTKNFEQIMSSLMGAIAVLNALGKPTGVLVARYESIRSALAAAVHAVHIPWLRMDEDALDQIGRALEHYKYVFSTNYDLLIYWSMIHRNDLEQEDVFKDYFWTRSDDETTAFHISDADVYGNPTRVLFPHGALHLVRNINGETHKLCNQDEATILDRFGDPILEDTVPLIVTEGDADAKLASIQQSDYLTFAFRELSERRGPLVVFGHSLSDSDEHLIDALYRPRDWEPPRLVAVSMLPGPARTLSRRQARYRGLFHNCELLFFDASTHPLGGKALKQPGPKIIGAPL